MTRIPSFSKISQTETIAACAMVCCLFCLGFNSDSGSAADLNQTSLSRSLANSPLTEQEQIVHVLNRLAFGPTPGDIDKVRALGLPEYIHQQLNPRNIDDSELEKRLESMETIWLSSSELARRYPRPRKVQSSQRRSDTSMEAKKRGQSTGEMGTRPNARPRPDNQARRKYREGLRKIALELQQAKILRATYSERQLQEVMTDFWFNHFNVFLGKGADRILTTAYEREVIRAHALGNFHDLLVATAKSPAMLFYLDNWMSADPNAEMRRRSIRRRFGRNRQSQNLNAPNMAQQRRRGIRGLNENYARELMELHTLGVDGGYTQKDVTEVARCFTGWTIRNPRQGGGFQFVNFLHDNGEKTVLGEKITAGGGIKDGEIVLEMLSTNPSTAHFISTKLCRRFVSDDPPEALVKRCADVFLETRGDIRRVLADIFSSPEFYSMESYRAKIKKPFELVVSTLRASNAEARVALRMLRSLRTMGEALYGCRPPTGYEDTADAWINPGSLLERLNFALDFAGGKIRGSRIGLDYSKFTSSKTDELVRDMSMELLYRVPGDEFIEAITEQVEIVEASRRSKPDRKVRTIAGLILGSPEFQRR